MSSNLKPKFMYVDGQLRHILQREITALATFVSLTQVRVT